MKTISNPIDELRQKFEALFKKYEIAGSSHVSFEELQVIFKEIKEVKLKLSLALDKASKQLA